MADKKFSWSADPADRAIKTPRKYALDDPLDWQEHNDIFQDVSDGLDNVNDEQMTRVITLDDCYFDTAYGRPTWGSVGTRPVLLFSAGTATPVVGDRDHVFFEARVYASDVRVTAVLSTAEVAAYVAVMGLEAQVVGAAGNFGAAALTPIEVQVADVAEANRKINANFDIGLVTAPVDVRFRFYRKPDDVNDTVSLDVALHKLIVGPKP